MYWFLQIAEWCYGVFPPSLPYTMLESCSSVVLFSAFKNKFWCHSVSVWFYWARQNQTNVKQQTNLPTCREISWNTKMSTAWVIYMSNNAEEMSQLSMTDIILKINPSVYLLQELDRAMSYDSWQLQQHWLAGCYFHNLTSSLSCHPIRVLPPSTTVFFPLNINNSDI